MSWNRRVKTEIPDELPWLHGGDLIVRQLKHAKGDQVLLKVLPVASRLAKRVAR